MPDPHPDNRALIVYQKDDWTPSQVKELVLSRIDSNDRLYQTKFELQAQAVSAALAAADRAIQKAEAASEKRFDNTNEWRQTFSDRDRTLMPRQEAELVFSNLRQQLAALTTDSRDQVTTLKAQIDGFVSKGAGRTESWGLVLGIGAIVFSALTALATFMIVKQ